VEEIFFGAVCICLLDGIRARSHRCRWRNRIRGSLGVWVWVWVTSWVEIAVPVVSAAWLRHVGRFSFSRALVTGKIGLYRAGKFVRVDNFSASLHDFGAAFHLVRISFPKYGKYDAVVLAFAKKPSLSRSNTFCPAGW